MGEQKPMSLEDIRKVTDAAIAANENAVPRPPTQAPAKKSAGKK